MLLQGLRPYDDNHSNSYLEQRHSKNETVGPHTERTEGPYTGNIGVRAGTNRTITEVPAGHRTSTIFWRH